MSKTYGSTNWGCLAANSADGINCPQWPIEVSKCSGFSYNIPCLMSAQLLCQIVRHWRTAKDMLGMLTPSSEYTCITWFHKEYLSSALVQLIPGSLITCILCKLKSRPYLSYRIRTIHCDAQFPEQEIKQSCPRDRAMSGLNEDWFGSSISPCLLLWFPITTLHFKICHFTSWESHNFKWDRLHSAD